MKPFTQAAIRGWTDLHAPGYEPSAITTRDVHAMSGTHDLWLFVLSGLLLNIPPGPDTAYIPSAPDRNFDAPADRDRL
jgi:hypothetical protein